MTGILVMFRESWLGKVQVKVSETQYPEMYKALTDQAAKLRVKNIHFTLI